MKYGFIGCGNMGGAIARALAKNTLDFAITDRSGKAKALAAELGCRYECAEYIAENCDRIFLAVKPQMMAEALAGLQSILQEKKPLLITMAAGLEMSRIEELAGTALPVIRIMPNTPVAVGKGVIPYCANALVEKDILTDVMEDLSQAGMLEALGESLMDAVSALSGCGPAYVYMFIEAMADGAVACGIPRAKALEFAAATVAGAAEMVLATGQHPGQLKDAVCSPGGSTIAGVRSLEQHGFRGAVMDCLNAAYRRNQELGK